MAMYNGQSLAPEWLASVTNATPKPVATTMWPTVAATSNTISYSGDNLQALMATTPVRLTTTTVR